MSLQITNNLTDEVVDRIKGTKLENKKTALLEIACNPPAEQLVKVEELLNKDANKIKVAPQHNVAYKMDFVRKKVVVDGKWEDVPPTINMEENNYNQLIEIIRATKGNQQSSY